MEFSLKFFVNIKRLLLHSIQSLLRHIFSLSYTFLIFAFIFFFLGFFYQHFKPRLNSFLIEKVSNFTEEEFNFHVSWKNFKWKPFSLNLILSQFELSAIQIKKEKKEEKKQLSPIFIEKVKLSFRPLSLYRGLKHIFKLHLSHVKTFYKIEKNTHEKEALTPLISFLHKVPFSEITFRHVNLYLSLSYYGKDYLIVTNTFNGLFKKFPYTSKRLKVTLEERKLEMINVKRRKKISIQIQTDLIIAKRGIQINQLHIQHENAFLKSKGFLKLPLNLSEWDKNDFDFFSQSKINEKVLISVFSLFFDQKKIFPFKGDLNITAEISKFENHPSKFIFKTNSKGFSFLSHKLSSFSAQFQWEKNENLLLVPFLTFRHQSGLIKGTHGSFHLFSPYRFRVFLQTKDLELSSLLKGFDIPKNSPNKVPIHLKATGIFPCRGRIFPEPLVSCKGETLINDLFVKIKENNQQEKKTKKRGKHIVHVKKIKASGFVQVNQDHVFYKAYLIDKSSSSQTQTIGKISYKKGFKIFYQGHLKKLKAFSLLDLKMKGRASFKGTVSGDKSYAIINAKIKAKNFSLNKFKLGRLKFNLNYKKKLLSFKNLKGKYRSSNYRGYFAIHVSKEKIKLEMKSSQLALFDVAQAVKKQYFLPFKTLGQGSFKIKLWGPLKMDQLSYDLFLKIKRGFIYKESFIDFVAQINTRKGLIKIPHLVIGKELGRLRFRGTLSSKGVIDGVLFGENLLFEELNVLKPFPLNGTLRFVSSFRGPLLHPDIEAEVHITKSSLELRHIEDSYFKFSILKDLFKGEGYFMGKTVKTRFQIPFHSFHPSHVSHSPYPSHPFYFFLKLENFNVAEILRSLPFMNLDSQLKTNISAIFDLKSSKGLFWDSTGTVKMNQFQISYDPFLIESPQSKPVELIFKNGVIDTHFELNGNGGFLKLISKASKENDLNFSLKSKLKMQFFSIFTDFLQGLEGELSSALKIKGPYKAPHIFGSAFLNKTRMSFKNFPLTFNDVKSDIFFNHKNIVINYLQGNVGGGSFSASGKVKVPVKGKSTPIHLKGSFKDVAFDLEELKTKGSGEFSIKGKKTPYKIKGFYKIKEGNIKADLDFYKEKRKEESKFPFFVSNASPFSPSRFHLDFRTQTEKAIPMKVLLGSLDIHSSLTGFLHLRGPFQDLNVVGDLTTSGGSLIFNSNNNFDIRNGKVIYNNSSLDNPEINFVAESRVASADKEEYDIRLLAQGSLENLLINLNSSPHLQEEDILSLLVMGALPFREESSYIDKNLSYKFDTALLNTQLGVKRFLRKSIGLDINFSSTIKESEENVDELTLRYQINPNFIAEAAQTVEGDTKTRVKFEYKLNKNFSFSSQLAQRDNNSLQDGKNTNNNIFGLDFEYKVEF